MNNIGDIRLKLYTDNPKKIKVLMLKDETGNILGRAIIWRNAFARIGESAEDRNNAETFKTWIMDRVYSTEDWIIDLFEKYARHKGWYTRTNNRFEFITPTNELVKMRVKINLTNFEFGGYPYLDTMRSVSKKGTISNKRWKDEVRFY